MKTMLAVALAAAPLFAAAQGGPSVNENTGDLSYSYPFNLAPARGRHQPALGLVFSSSSRANRGFGFGWDLTDSYIEKDVRVAPSVDLANDAGIYTMVRGGARETLVTTFSGFQTEIIREPLTIAPTFTNARASSWMMTDSQGTVSTFDFACGERLYLSQVVDIDGNRVIYRHDCAKGLTEVLYNLKGDALTPDTEYLHRVEFQYEASTAVPVENVAGLLVSHAFRLKKVVVQGPSRQTIRSFTLDYTTTDTSETILQITERGYQDVQALPATTFQYDQPGDLFFGTEGTASMVGGDATIDEYDWIDLDGDGLADLKIGLNWRRTELSNGHVQFGALQPIVPDSYHYATASGQFRDFDGDGVVDFLHTGSSGPTGNCVGQLVVYFGKRSSTGLSFDEGVCIDISAITSIITPFNGLPPQPTKDVNGDGVLDYVVSPAASSDSVVFFGKKTSAGWRFVRWGVSFTSLPGLGELPSWGKPFDANADGLPDVVQERPQVATTPGGVELQTYRSLYGGSYTTDSVYLSSWPNGWVHQTATTFGPSDLPPRYKSTEPAAAGQLYSDTPPATPATGDCWTRFNDPSRSYFTTVDVNGDGVPDFVQNGAWGYATSSHYSGSFPVPDTSSSDQLRLSIGLPRGGVLPSRQVRQCDGACYLYGPSSLPAALGEGNQNPRWRAPALASSATFSAGDSIANYQCLYTAAPLPIRTGLEKARIIDLDGDGVVDYVHVSLGQQPTVRKGALASVEVARAILLRAVTTPSGLRTAFAYASSRKFGDRSSTRPVVVTVTSTGANVETQVTRYWYAAGTDVKVPNPHDLARKEDMGFETSWSWSDGPSLRWARQTTWNIGSFALKGTATGTSEGPVTSAQVIPPSGPPQFTVSKTTSTSYGLRALGQTACSPGAAYPLRVIPMTVDTRTLLDDGLGGRASAGTFTSTVCADVDSVGRVLRSQRATYMVSPAGAQYWGGTLETTLGLSGGTPSACRLVDRKMTVTQRDLGANRVLARQSVEYNDHCQKVAEYGEQDDGTQRKLKTWTYRPLGTGTAAWFGLPVSSMSVGVTTSYDYGLTSSVPYLYVWAETTSDGGTRSLKTVRSFQELTGWKVWETGPIVQFNGVPSQTMPQITRYYLHDSFGRTLAIAKQPFTGSGTVGQVPDATQGNQVVEAHEYNDTATPRFTRSYKFAQPKTYALGSSLTSDDVMVSTSYLDDANREIQVKERLGTGVAGPGGDTAGGGNVRSTPALTGWKVTKSVWFDDAGRAAVSWEPHLVASEAFSSPKSAAQTSTRATATAFDSEGRPWCSATTYVASGGAKPSAPIACASDSSHTASFKMATETRYRARQIAGRGPYGGWFVETISVPPDLNVVGRSGSVSALSGPGGQAFGSIDADGRRTWVEYDLVGREIASWREGGSDVTPNPGSGWGQERTTGSPQAASWIHYDKAGFPYETWEANAPTVVRQVRYDTYGRIQTIFPNVNVPSEYINYTYGELGRVTRIDEVSAAGTRSSWNKYDEPYNGAGAATASEYGYTAGKITSTGVDRAGQSETTIAYGYDDAGRLTRRDQWFLKLDGTRRFTVSSTYGGDGRVLDSKVRNPYATGDTDTNPYFQYQVHFDSAGRPVEIFGKSLAWSATPVFESMYQASGYDALDRPGAIAADVGQVVTARLYDQFSGRLTGECKRRQKNVACMSTAPGVSDIFRTDLEPRATYEGTRLKSYVETIGSSSNTTTYATNYLPSGRVSSTQAFLTGTAQAQTQVYSESFTYNGIGMIATAATTRNTGVAGRTAVNRNEAITQVAGLQSGTVIDQMKVVADTGTATGKVGQDARYGFDLANRLVSVTRAVGESEVLDYGPDGELLRRRITSGSTSKDVFYVGEYATATASNCTATCVAAVNSVAVDAHVIYAGTRIASARAASQDGLTTNRTLYYYRTRLGSVIGTSLRNPTIGAGSLPGAYYRYTPYGEVDLTNETDTTKSELGYTNALRLTGGLIHLVNRAYDAEAKVFVQSDVVDRLRYAYAGGDPINRSDPTGLRWAVNSNEMTPMMWFATPSGVSEAQATKQATAGGGGGESKNGKPATKPPVARSEAPKTDQKDQVGVSKEAVATSGKSEKTGANRDGERLIRAIQSVQGDPTASEAFAGAKGRATISTGDLKDGVLGEARISRVAQGDGKVFAGAEIVMDFAKIDALNDESRAKYGDKATIISDGEVLVHELSHVLDAVQNIDVSSTGGARLLGETRAFSAENYFRESHGQRRISDDALEEALHSKPYDFTDRVE